MLSFTVLRNFERKQGIVGYSLACAIDQVLEHEKGSDKGYEIVTAADLNEAEYKVSSGEGSGERNGQGSGEGSGEADVLVDVVSLPMPHDIIATLGKAVWLRSVGTQ